jgi:hypothetical protein
VAPPDEAAWPCHGILPRRLSRHCGASVVTARGFAAFQIDEGGAQPEAGTDPRSSRRVAAAARRKEARTEAPQQSAKPSRGASKQAWVIEMLRRQQGATIATIMKATGWQPHSVRSFFTGVVRNKLGLTLVSEKNSGDRVYRIVAGKAAPKRKGKSSRKAA